MTFNLTGNKKQCRATITFIDIMAPGESNRQKIGIICQRPWIQMMTKNDETNILKLEPFIS